MFLHEIKPTNLLFLWKSTASGVNEHWFMQLNFPAAAPLLPCWWLSGRRRWGWLLLGGGVLSLILFQRQTNDSNSSCCLGSSWDYESESCSFSVLGAGRWFLVLTVFLLVVFFSWFTAVWVWESGCIREKTKIQRLYARLNITHLLLRLVCFPLWIGPSAMLLLLLLHLQVSLQEEVGHVHSGLISCSRF